MPNFCWHWAGVRGGSSSPAQAGTVPIPATRTSTVREAIRWQISRRMGTPSLKGGERSEVTAPVRVHPDRDIACHSRDGPSLGECCAFAAAALLVFKYRLKVGAVVAISPCTPGSRGVLRRRDAGDVRLVTLDPARSGTRVRREPRRNRRGR